ncbi:hypothetical protein KSP39_PZI019328 [Platanthera zijinensis]|uniref:Uncharacterized protein n=1 Tax=Platanthera zijinensis TaxID=2320716 RepID=A0AAP0B1X3_9ASPA
MSSPPLFSYLYALFWPICYDQFHHEFVHHILLFPTYPSFTPHLPLSPPSKFLTLFHPPPPLLPRSTHLHDPLTHLLPDLYPLISIPVDSYMDSSTASCIKLTPLHVLVSDVSEFLSRLFECAKRAGELRGAAVCPLAPRIGDLLKFSR